jgi:peptidyl-prolyl cis-trans isomerase D
MIIATFVFMIPGLGDGGGAVNAAAEVGSSTISLRDYTDQLRRTRDQYSKLFNGEIPPYFEQNLKNQVLQGLVRKEVLSQYAKKQNLIVAPVEVADFIKKEIPAFQEDGEFSYALYNTYLRNTRTTAKKFEEMVSKDITSRRLYDMLSQALEKPEQETTLDSEASNVEITYSYIQLNESDIASAVKVSDQIVDDFIADAENQKLLSQKYSENSSNYEKPATAEISYMLIKDQNQANEIAKSLTAENFAEVAREKSEDALSKGKGGDLGLVTRGSFNPEIEAKAFSMKAGEVSEPFKTGLGYAMIHVRSLKPKAVQPFEEVKREIAKGYLQTQGVDSFKAQLAEAVSQGSSALESKLNQAGLKWSQEDKYSLSDPSLPGIGESNEIAEKLISLRKSEVYKNIVSHDGKDFLIKLNDLTSKESTDENKTAQNATSSRGNDLVEVLYENEKEALNIELNRQILEQ